MQIPVAVFIFAGDKGHTGSRSNACLDEFLSELL
jgi:hypothetical protein